jgi:O-antigen/teichoic acid export membrane protein
VRLLRSGGIYVLANLATAGLPFLLLPILTRALGPAEYGQVVAFSLIVTLAGALAGFNVHAAVGVMWFRHEPAEMRGLVGSALVLALLSTLVVAPAVALVLHLWPAAGGGLTPAWGAVAAVTAGANVLIQARLGLWQAQEMPWRLAALQFSTAAVNLALSLFAVLVLGLGAEGRNGGYAAATLLAAGAGVLTLIAQRELCWKIQRTQFEDLIRFGGPLTFHILAAAMLATADRWMVSIRLDPHALGVYGAGAQLGMVMAILGDAFVKAYAPWLYGRLRSEDPEDRLWAVGAAYGVVPIFLAVGLVMGVVMSFAAGVVLGPEYAASAVVLPWFMLGGALNGVYLSISSFYFFSGRTGLLAAVTMTSGVVGLALTAAMTIAFGMVGAAMGYAASQSVLGAVAIFIAIRRFDLPWGRPQAALRLMVAKVAASLMTLARARIQGS